MNPGLVSVRGGRVRLLTDSPLYKKYNLLFGLIRQLTDSTIGPSPDGSGLNSLINQEQQKSESDLFRT